ncbi:hypothetical protein LCGC14_0376820 [marine sediment metagenome]|uniref:Uncharacterized protein n=1 Tax=marine sediment metagenome TaxID=412755 RepID=A0A0F9VQS4_9ZZZZ
MAATTDQTFWGFLWWIKHNRGLSIESMTEDDLDELVLAFTTVNTTLCTFSTTDPLAYGTLEFPQRGGLDDGNGVTAAATQAVADQSHYPKTHYGGA